MASISKPQMLAQALTNMNPAPEIKGSNFIGGRAFKRGDLSPEQVNTTFATHHAMGTKLPVPTEPTVSFPKPSMAKIPAPHIPRIK